MHRSAAWRYAAIALLGGAGALACGLSVVASGSGDAVDNDAATVEPHDGAVATETGVDAADATVEDAGCVPVVVDDPLTSISPITWLTYSSQADYPKAKDPGSGTLMVAIAASMEPSQHADLWLRTPVPTTAFDVSFDYLLACTTNEYCADGLAAVWMDTLDAGALAVANPGVELGIPKLGGGAAAIKLDVKLGDPDPKADTFPSLIVHAMEAGTSDTSATKTLRGDTLVGQLRHVKLRLRKGQVSVDSTDDAGTSISVIGATRAGFLGYFGFAASTGLHVDAAYVGSFHGAFYACEPP